MESFQEQPERLYSSVDGLLESERRLISPRLTPAEAILEIAQGAKLIDMRELQQRMEDGVIPGAIQVNPNVLEWRCDPNQDNKDRHPAIDPDNYSQRLIVLCNQGFQSSLKAANLVRLGLKYATDVDGGFEEWVKVSPVEPFEEGK
jgi:rhodanese-related sulfurtransferase